MSNIQPLIDDWLEARRQLNLAITHERTLRDELVLALFPEAKRGTNNLTLADGRIAKYVRKLNIKLTNAARDLAGLKEAIDDGKLPEGLIRSVVVHEVNESKYASLTTEQLNFLNGALEVKDAAPDLKIA